MKIEIKKSRSLVDYFDAIKYLEKRVEKVIKGEKPELLWILEHPLTYTAGIRFNDNDVLDKNIKVTNLSTLKKDECIELLS